MIREAVQYGSLVNLFDEEGSQVGSLSIGNGEFVGHSRDFVVIRYQDMIVTMDSNQRILGRLVIDGRYRIGSITEAGFTARVDSAVEVYDKYCNHKNHYTV